MHRILSETVFSGVRISLLLILVLGETALSSAQVKQPGGFFSKRLSISAGASYSPQEETTPASAGIGLSPQLFISTAFTDFSVSINPSPGIFYSFSDSQDVSKKIFFQLPVMAHVNIGHLASKDFHSTYGFFAGAGWNLQLGQGKSTGGFAWDAGIRFWLFGQSFTAMYHGLPVHEKIFSSGNFFSLQINLGKYLSLVKANNKVTNFMKPYREKK